MNKPSTTEQAPLATAQARSTPSDAIKNFCVQDGHNRFQLVSDDHGAVATIEQDGEFWLGNDDLHRLLMWLLKHKGNR